MPPPVAIRVGSPSQTPGQAPTPFRSGGVPQLGAQACIEVYAWQHEHTFERGSSAARLREACGRISMFMTMETVGKVLLRMHLEVVHVVGAHVSYKHVIVNRIIGHVNPVKMTT